jgi:predicted dehydrogenase
MGTHGSLSIPTMRLRTHDQAQDRSWWKPMALEQVAMHRQDPIQLQMAHFGQVVRGQAAPLVSVQDGLANLQVTEAIVRAAQSEQAVRVQEIR